MIHPYPAPVFAEGHIQLPVQIILHRPLASDIPRQFCRRSFRKARDIKTSLYAGLARKFAIVLPMAFHQDQPFDRKAVVRGGFPGANKSAPTKLLAECSKASTKCRSRQGHLHSPRVLGKIVGLMISTWRPPRRNSSAFMTDAVPPSASLITAGGSGKLDEMGACGMLAADKSCFWKMETAFDEDTDWAGRI